MRDLIVDVLKIIAPLSVALIVFAEALGIAPSAVADFFKRQPALMLRSLVVALVLVPAAALALVLLLGPAPAVAIGLAILVACPPAPMMIKAAPTMGGGDAAFLASLHLSLAALAVVTVPLALKLLSVPLGFNASVDIPSLLWILARTILIPIGLGLAVRVLFPAWAEAFGAGLAKAGTAGVLVVVVFALAALYPALLNMDARSYGVIAACSAAALAIGHVLGPQDPKQKTILAVECAVRHPALALTIAATNFTPQQALPVLLPCVITFTLVAMVYLFVRGRTQSAS